jgi:glucose-6-phosphate 1-epimerase
MPDPSSLIHRLSRGGAAVEVSRSGGHVVSWRPAGDGEFAGGEVLFLSQLARPETGQSIRGGVPVIFPQFANLGALPKHGFVRTALWHVAERPERGDDLTLYLEDDEQTRAVWPHRFRLSLGVSVASGTLRLALRAVNTGTSAFEFTAALHTYLRVTEIGDVSVEGLDGIGFRDKTAEGRERVQDGPLTIGAPVDSVYQQAPDQLVVREGQRRALEVSKAEFDDWVVWNPWASGAAEIDDLGDEEYRQMVCVEAAQVSRPVRLGPGQRWEGAQTLRLQSA